MLEVLGGGYVIDHCISAFLEEKQHQLYQNYIAESLRIIAQNTAQIPYIEKGEYMAKSYLDLTDFDRRKEKSKPKSGEELVAEFCKRLGIKEGK